MQGAPSLGLKKLSNASVAAAVVGTGAVVALLSALFWVPYVYCKVARKDYSMSNARNSTSIDMPLTPHFALAALRFYHFFLGPMLWYRQPPADAVERAASVPDYRLRPDRPEEVQHAAKPQDAELSHQGSTDEKLYEDPTPAEGLNQKSLLDEEVERKAKDPHPIEGAWIEPKNLWIILRYKAVPFVHKALTYSTSVDLHRLQAGEAGTAQHARMMAVYEVGPRSLRFSTRAGSLTSVHSFPRQRARQYPNETEACYSFVQVLTACVNCESDPAISRSSKPVI